VPTALREVATLFLKLGLTAFGGPAAHIALMHDECVRRRRWLTDAEFLDLIGLVNLIPGPNSTEMAIHIGKRRAGWGGFAAGGVAFILPAVLIVMGLAWAYTRFGATPQVAGLLYGVKPVVIALIAQALWSLTPKAVKSARTAVIGAAVLLLAARGGHEILLLFGGGAALMLSRGLMPTRSLNGAALALPAAGAAAAAVAVPFGFTTLFMTFLKIGAVMYGSGYVLLAFLRADLVTRLGWLTDPQLLDAVAIGQVTPGPLFTTATFIGYLLGGAPGALLATLGIFLPSFVFVAVSGPLLPRLRRSPWTAAFLDGVNVAALALMAVVAWRLGRASLVDAPTIAAALLALVLLMRTKIASLWLIGGAAALGLLKTMIGG
jgi:chromate transporter